VLVPPPLNNSGQHERDCARNEARRLSAIGVRRDGDEAPLRKLLAQLYLAFSEAEELETCVCGRCMCVYREHIL
jgi:hypothetical protein